MTNVPAANTGNIGFTGDAIYGINGIYLENADLSHSATAAVVLPANGDTGAIQLNNTYGNIILQAGNTENITASWSFDNAGALNLPNGANIADSSFNAGSPSASVSLSAFSPDGNTVTIQAQGNTSSAVIKTYANSTSTTNQWKFDSNGKLTTAGETWVKSGDDYNSIVFSPNGTDNNGQIKVDSGTNMVVSAASNFYVKQAGSDRLAITNADTDLMASANVVIQSNKAGTANTWTFVTNGRLIFPDGNTSIVRNPDTGRINFDAGVDGGGGISFGPTSNTYITGSQAVGIQAGFGNETAYNWTFGTDGTLSAPGNISTTGNITGNYILGDGSQLTNLPGGSSNYIENGTSSVAILSTDGNATIGVNATPVANFGVGQVSIIGNVLGNYFIGNGSQLTGLPATYGNANVAAYLPTYSGNLNAGNIISSGNANINLDPAGTGIVAIIGSASATGNIVTAGNFVGNGAALTNVTVSVAGNVVGTQPNVNIVAGSYTYTFDNTGNVTLPTGGDLVFSANTTLTSVGGTNGNITINPDGTGQLVVTNITPAYFGNSVAITGPIRTGNGSYANNPGNGDIVFNNGGIDTPGVTFYYGNNTNFGIDSYSGNAITTPNYLRIVKNLNEAGSAELIKIDQGGNISFAGSAMSIFTTQRKFDWTAMIHGNPATGGSITGSLLGNASYTNVSDGVTLTPNTTGQSGSVAWNTTTFDFTKDFVMEWSWFTSTGGVNPADGVWATFGGNTNGGAASPAGTTNGSIGLRYQTFTNLKTQWYSNGATTGNAVAFRAGVTYQGEWQTSRIMVRTVSNKRYAYVYTGVGGVCDNAIDVTSWTPAGTWIAVGASTGSATSGQLCCHVALEYL